MKKSIKWIVISGALLIVIGLSYASYMYFMPHRDIQIVEVFEKVEASQLVESYLTDPDAANNRYLDSEGESKVIVVSGSIKSIITDQMNQKVVILKSSNENLGVSCSFTLESNQNLQGFKVGDPIQIKGVIRSGAEYDEDLDLYEDVILEKCDVIR
ncbi:MAG: hypothetical protein KDD41_02120 [Flavobacteriales bacterium]|nr:hypothetical protein [Flavobacteriales bacterium]